MGTPQIIVIVLYAMSAAISLEQVAEGKEKPGFFVSKLVSIAVIAALLWWGGFFK